jgi:hypothetical protein
MAATTIKNNVGNGVFYKLSVKAYITRPNHQLRATDSQG